MVFLFILLIIFLLLLFSKIRIEVINFKFSSMTPRHINKDYRIVIKLCILGKIPILKINITKTKLERLKVKEKIKQIDFEVLKDSKQFDKKLIEAVKKLNVIIPNINLKIELGTENAALTAMIVPILSTIIANIFRRKVKKQRFQINPIYINQNMINILISGIFEIKMIHIITIIYILNKKEGVGKYERTSNRRPYDYSYE